MTQDQIDLVMRAAVAKLENDAGPLKVIRALVNLLVETKATQNATMKQWVVDFRVGKADEQTALPTNFASQEAALQAELDAIDEIINAIP
jgi:hypothetical protein